MAGVACASNGGSFSAARSCSSGDIKQLPKSESIPVVSSEPALPKIRYRRIVVREKADCLSHGVMRHEAVQTLSIRASMPVFRTSQMKRQAGKRAIRVRAVLRAKSRSVRSRCSRYIADALHATERDKEMLHLSAAASLQYKRKSCYTLYIRLYRHLI